MSDDILDLLSGRKTNQEAKGTSSSSNSSYFANKYLNKSNNTSSASSTLKNGNYNSAPTRSGSSGYDEVTDAPLDLMNKVMSLPSDLVNNINSISPLEVSFVRHRK